MKITLAALGAAFGLITSHSSNDSSAAIGTRRLEVYRGSARNKTRKKTALQHDGSPPFLRERIEEIISECHSEPIIYYFMLGKVLKVPVTWTARGVLLAYTNLGVRLTNTLRSQPLHFLRPVDRIESFTGPILPGQKMDLRFNDSVLVNDSIVIVYPRQ
jgi:hypothetical protein